MFAKPMLLGTTLLLVAAALPLPAAEAHICIGQSWECACPAPRPHIHVCIDPDFDVGGEVLRALLGHVAP